MSDKQINLLQGTLDLLILKVLALEEMHGLGISHRIKQVTKGTFRSSQARSFRHYTDWSRQAGSFPPGVHQTTTAGPSTIGSPRLAKDTLKLKPRIGNASHWR